MASSNRNSYRSIYNALMLDGLVAFNQKEYTPSETYNADAGAFLSKLDNYFQQCEDKIFQTLLEQCASINPAKDVEEEIARLLKEGVFTFNLVEDATDEEEAALTLRIQKIITEKVIPHLKKLQQTQLQMFLEAVINDDRKKVTSMLANPELAKFLLLTSPPEDMVIENKLTWQKFYAENALTMAVKRKQLEMIKQLLPFYDQLEQTEEVLESKHKAMSAWQSYEMQKNSEGEDEIVIPQEYATLAQSLIDVFKDETFPNGVPGRNNIPCHVELSEKTELALASFLNILVPKTAVILDNHVDEELLLLAIYKAYNKNFDAFNYNLDKLDTLCIRVMGLTQSALIPETGKIFCEGLYDVVTAIENGKEIKISDLAAQHKLKSGESLYRAGRDSRSGSGFEFLCGILGSSLRVRGVFICYRGVWTASVWENYVAQKQQTWGNYAAAQIEPEAGARVSNSVRR